MMPRVDSLILTYCYMPDKRRAALTDSRPPIWWAGPGSDAPAQRTLSKSSRRESPVSERIHRARKWGSAATAGVAVLVAAACSSSGSGHATGGNSSAATSAKISKIAIAVPAKTTDYGWNQQGVNAARTVASASGAHLTVLSDIGYNNTQALLSQLARAHAQFIIAHASGFDTAAK